MKFQSCSIHFPILPVVQCVCAVRCGTFVLCAKSYGPHNSYMLAQMIIICFCFHFKFFCAFFRLFSFFFLLFGWYPFEIFARAHLNLALFTQGNPYSTSCCLCERHEYQTTIFLRTSISHVYTDSLTLSLSVWANQMYTFCSSTVSSRLKSKEKIIALINFYKFLHDRLAIGQKSPSPFNFEQISFLPRNWSNSIYFITIRHVKIKRTKIVWFYFLFLFNCLPLTHVAFDHHLDVNSFSGRARMVSLPPPNDDDDDDISVISQIYFPVADAVLWYKVVRPICEEQKRENLMCVTYRRRRHHHHSNQLNGRVTVSMCVRACLRLCVYSINQWD